MTPCKRKCWNCGNVAEHEDNVTPYVLCSICGSQDTRLVRDKEPESKWNEFRKAGLLWWVNRILHTFGWAIICETDDVTGNVVNAYPMRVDYFGFDAETDEEELKKFRLYPSPGPGTLGPHATAEQAGDGVGTGPPE